MSRILVVDDETKLTRLIAAVLSDRGHTVDTASHAKEASGILASRRYDLMVTDVRLPRASGLDLLRDAHESQPDLAVIVMTAYGTVSGAVEAMRRGAFDYLQKPFELEALALLAERALESARLQRDNTTLRSEAASRLHRLVALSPGMRRVTDQLERIAPTDTTVLILGESGVGKELVTRTLHEHSPRRERPMVRVNCPAIPRDLVESELFGHVRGAFTGASDHRAGLVAMAEGSTLFLDEVGDLPLEQQAKLLHVLEERTFSRVGTSEEITADVRVVAATNQDLEAAMRDGRFRADLYYRLAVVPIHVPPLRERREDLSGLVDELLDMLRDRLNRPRLRLAPEALAELQAYTWPGNVRELRNVLERAAVLSRTPELTADDLFLDPAKRTAPLLEPGQDLASAVDAFKHRVLLQALREHGWRKGEAAESLGISARAMSHYVRRLELDRER